MRGCDPGLKVVVTIHGISKTQNKEFKAILRVPFLSPEYFFIFGDDTTETFTYVYPSLKDYLQIYD
jgi:hypothetical protein